MCSSDLLEQKVQKERTEKMRVSTGSTLHGASLIGGVQQMLVMMSVAMNSKKRKTQ